MKNHDEEKDWVHLTTAGNDIEFELLAGLLQMAGIPTLKKSKGVDKFVGVPIAGVDVMVPAGMYDEALQIINTPVDEEELEEEEKETE